MVAEPHTAQSDLHSNILKVLATDAAPKVASAISKALPVGGRPKPKELARALSEMAAAGSILVIPGKTPKFMRAPAETWAQAMVLEVLQKGKLTEAKLAQALSPHDDLAAGVIAHLKSAGKVFVHPATGAKNTPVSYALVPPDPITYIGKDLDKLLAMGEKKGFTQEAVRAAVLSRLGPAPPTVTAARAAGGRPPIVAAMRSIEPRADLGVSVPIASLRQELGGQYGQAAIDQEILTLAAQAILNLHSPPWGARLSAEQKSALIEDGRGGWFDAVTLRRQST